jgi:hemimethylated DNA binding protein
MPTTTRLRAATMTVPLLATLSFAQFGTIQIDWDSEDAESPSSAEARDWIDEEPSGMELPRARPRLVGFDDVDDPPVALTEEEQYEQAWQSGGFADDTVHEWFGASPATRKERPPAVTFRIGVVYTHATSGARGVVVGWDERTRAPREWIHLNAGQLGASLARLHAPHYSVLEEIEQESGEVSTPRLHPTQEGIAARC